MSQVDLSALVDKHRFTRRHLEQIPFAHGRGDLAQMLLPFQYNDVEWLAEDFHKLTDGEIWTLATDTGPTAFAASAVSGRSVARGIAGTTADRFLSLIGPALFKGDNSILMQVTFSFSAVTELAFEIGLIDAVTDGTLRTLTVDTATFANGADDGVVLAFDTDETQDKLVIGTADSGDADAVAEVGGASGNLVPTAGDYDRITLVVKGNDVFYAWEPDYQDADTIYEGWVTGALEGGTALAPWLFFGTLDTTSKNLDIDRVDVMTLRV